MAFRTNMLSMAKTKSEVDKNQQDITDTWHDELHNAYSPVAAEPDPAKQAQMLATINQGLLQRHPNKSPSDLVQWTSPDDFKMAMAAYTTDKWTTAEGAALRGHAAATQAGTAQTRENAELPGSRPPRTRPSGRTRRRNWERLRTRRPTTSSATPAGWRRASSLAPGLRAGRQDVAAWPAGGRPARGYDGGAADPGGPAGSGCSQTDTGKRRASASRCAGAESGHRSAVAAAGSSAHSGRIGYRGHPIFQDWRNAGAGNGIVWNALADH